MRPGGRYDRVSYRDSRPGRHATRAAALADAVAEAAAERASEASPPGVLDLCTRLGDGGCFGRDPDFLDTCAADAAAQYANASSGETP
ncbi:hypothetical protein [Parafrankia sp. FMc2]|uniref:hypothetical protein n=1 Tax=Parafrankia sp. FMc2 TaxID=3233196 RepID=UPI0034D65032